MSTGPSQAPLLAAAADPAFLETCHRWLLFHHHCNGCGHGEDACEYGKVCAYGKQAFQHCANCSRRDCTYPRCDLIKNILNHHKECQDSLCQVCAPVRLYHARSSNNSKASPLPQPDMPSSPLSIPRLPSPDLNDTAAASTPTKQQHATQAAPLGRSSLPQIADGSLLSSMQPPLQLQGSVFGRQSTSVLNDGVPSLSADMLTDTPRAQQSQQQQGAAKPTSSGGSLSLFEARHRSNEPKRPATNGNSNGNGSSTPNHPFAAVATAHAAPTSSGVSSVSNAATPHGHTPSTSMNGSCSTSMLMGAPSGSVQALAEMQALHLDRSASMTQQQQQQQQQQQVGMMPAAAPGAGGVSMGPFAPQPQGPGGQAGHQQVLMQLPGGGVVQVQVPYGQAMPAGMTGITLASGPHGGGPHHTQVLSFGGPQQLPMQGGAVQPMQHMQQIAMPMAVQTQFAGGAPVAFQVQPGTAGTAGGFMTVTYSLPNGQVLQGVAAGQPGMMTAVPMVAGQAQGGFAPVQQVAVGGPNANGFFLAPAGATVAGPAGCGPADGAIWWQQAQGGPGGFAGMGHPAGGGAPMLVQSCAQLTPAT